MKTPYKIIGDLAEALESKNFRLIGIIYQGSEICGYSDKDSDKDFAFIWDGLYPDVKARKPIIRKIGGRIHQLQDIESVNKSVDMFESAEGLFNVSHVLSRDFFSFYDGLQTLGKYYEEQMLRIGAIVYGKICFDPTGKIKKYKESLEMTREHAKAIEQRIRDDLEYDLKLLEIAARRKSTLRYIQLIQRIIQHFHVLYYARKMKWLQSDKWFEKIAEDKGWDDEFVELIKFIKDTTPFEELTSKILMVADDWGYKPAMKHRS